MRSQRQRPIPCISPETDGLPFPQRFPRHRHPIMVARGACSNSSSRISVRAPRTQAPQTSLIQAPQTPRTQVLQIYTSRTQAPQTPQIQVPRTPVPQTPQTPAYRTPYTPKTRTPLAPVTGQPTTPLLSLGKRSREELLELGTPKKRARESII
jgi:hypothetical protein